MSPGVERATPPHQQVLVRLWGQGQRGCGPVHPGTETELVAVAPWRASTPPELFPPVLDGSVHLTARAFERKSNSPSSRPSLGADGKHFTGAGGQSRCVLGEPGVGAQAVR